MANGDVDPAGNQQQQPLQSVHAASVLSGLHTALHVEPPEEPLEADPLDPLPLVVEPLLLAEPLLPVLLLVEPPSLAEPLLPVLLLVEPLSRAEPLLPVLLLVEPLSLAEPLLPVLLLVEPLPLAEPLLVDPLLLVLLPSLPPPSSLGEPPVPLVLLLQAASPTVDEAPITTTTRNRLSIFMTGGIPRKKGQSPPVTVSVAEGRASRAAWPPGTLCPRRNSTPRTVRFVTNDALECQPGKAHVGTRPRSSAVRCPS